MVAVVVVACVMMGVVAVACYAVACKSFFRAMDDIDGRDWEDALAGVLIGIFMACIGTLAVLLIMFNPIG